MRLFLRFSGFCLAIIIFGCGCSSVDSGNAESGSYDYPSWANNVIEFRNEGTGDQYFTCLLRACCESPHSALFLDPGNPDNWKAPERAFNGKRARTAPLWGIEVEYGQGDGYTPGTGHHLLVGRNIPSGLEVNQMLYECCTCETELCQVSREFGDHAADWNFMLGMKEEILAQAGLDDSSPVRDRMAALCNYVAKKEGWSGKNLHPVDFCLHGGWCTGRANTVAAFASIIGVPSRVISMSYHTVAEALLGGKWRLVDNGKLKDCSLLEFIADPERYGAEANSFYKRWSCVSDGNEKDLEVLCYNLEAGSNWIFNLEGAYPGQPSEIEFMLVPVSGYAVAALYPEDPEPVYKCDGSPKMWLTPFHGTWQQGHNGTMRIGQNGGIRQFFYLSSLEGARYVRSCLLLPGGDSYDIPRDGGDWYYRVNGEKFYLRDHGGWKPSSHYQRTGRRCLGFDIPIESLNFASGKQAGS